MDKLSDIASINASLLKQKRSFQAFCVIVALVLLFISALYTVEQGERGVVLRFGKMIDVVDAGIHFKIPLIDSVRHMSIRTQKMAIKLSVYSKDVQGADVDFSVNYALSPDKVGDIYTKAGLTYADRLILPQVQSRPKDIFGKYNAVNIVQAREKLTREIQDELAAQFLNTDIVIQSVQLENIDFSDSYEHSVEERMKAEVEVQRVQQNLERERINADMIRTRAQGDADAKLARANADAKAIEILGRAQAEAIQAKAKALKDNPDYILMLKAERWNGVLPKTVLPNMAIPIINEQVQDDTKAVVQGTQPKQQ